MFCKKNIEFENDIVKSLAGIFTKNTDKNKEGKTENNRLEKRINIKIKSKNYYNELKEIQNVLEEMLNEKKSKVKKRHSKGKTKRAIDQINESSDPQNAKQVLEIYKRNKFKKKTTSNNSKENSHMENETILKGNPENKSSPKCKSKVIQYTEVKSKLENSNKVLSETSIVLNNDIPLKGFWNRSRTSVKLIKKLSERLKTESLRNLLIKDIVENQNSLNKSITSEDVVIRIFNDLQKEEKPEIKCLTADKVSSKEMAKVCTEEENNAKQIKSMKPICNPEGKANNFKRDKDVNKEQNLLKVEPCVCFMDSISRNTSSGSLIAPKASLGPSSMTVKEVADMVFSAAVVFERLPVELKLSKLVDLSPPESMLTAVSVLDLITKSLSSVNEKNTK